MTEQKQNKAMMKAEADALCDNCLKFIFFLVFLVLFLGTIALFASLVG